MILLLSGPVLTGATLLGLAGCASVPDVNPVIDNAGNAKPHLVGSRGPLTAAQSKAILDKLKRESGDADVLQRHLALEGAIDDSPIVVGNKVTLLPSGEAAQTAMFDAIQGAKNHVNLEYFTVEDIENNGRNLGDLLIEKHGAGVQVNVIYDSFGSAATPGAFFNKLKDGGVPLVDFNPVNPLKAKRAYAPNNRDHRKILVADAGTAIIGGVNLSKVYSSLPFASEKSDAPWKDIDMKIEGPAVAQLQGLFMADWKSQHGPALDESAMFPRIEARGDEVVHILGSSPSQAVPNYYASLLSAIRNAEARVWIAAAYFVPTRQEMADLLDAARRGVEVKLLLPGKSDSPLAVSAGRGRYAELMKNGIQVYETRDIMLHSKTAVIDGVWSAIGSSNFDHRSVIYNAEVDAIVLGKETGGELEAIFRKDFDEARRIDPAEWSRRPMPRRLHEFFSRLWQNML